MNALRHVGCSGLWARSMSCSQESQLRRKSEVFAVEKLAVKARKEAQTAVEQVRLSTFNLESA